MSSLGIIIAIVSELYCAEKIEVVNGTICLGESSKSNWNGQWREER